MSYPRGVILIAEVRESDNNVTNKELKDNKVMNEILVRMVQSCGFMPLSALNGSEAMAIVTKQRVDLVLMDVRFHYGFISFCKPH